VSVPRAGGATARRLGDRLVEAGLFSKAGDPTEGLSVKGNPSVVIPGYPVFGPDGAKALTSPIIADMPRRVEAGIVALGADERFAFPMFPMIDAGTDLVISDYRQTVRGAPVGTVERSPVAITDKATLPVTVAVANDPMSQVAIILEGVPVAVVEALPQFRTFAGSELRFQLAKALDPTSTPKSKPARASATPAPGSSPSSATPSPPSKPPATAPIWRSSTRPTPSALTSRPPAPTPNTSSRSGTPATRRRCGG
jgi:hypothetical protein